MPSVSDNPYFEEKHLLTLARLSFFFLSSIYQVMIPLFDCHKKRYIKRTIFAFLSHFQDTYLDYC